MRKNPQKINKQLPKRVKSWRAKNGGRCGEGIALGELLVGLKMEIAERLELLKSVEVSGADSDLNAKRQHLTYREVKAILDAGGKI